MGKLATDVGLEAVQSAIPKAIEARPEEPRDRVASMFGPLFKASYLKASELKTFFVESCEFLEDEICDVPLIATYYAKFIGHAVGDGVLEMGFLTEALAPLVGAELCREAAAIDGNRGAAFMAASILQVIKGREGGEEAAKRAYASFDLTALMPEGSKTAAAVVSLLGAAELAYVDPSLAEQARSAAEASAAADSQQQLTALEAHLRTELGEAEPHPEGLNTEALKAWVSANCSAIAHATIARTVMRCALETATSDEPPPAQKIQQQIERCKVLLIQYCAAGSEGEKLQAQAACLYEVQAFCGRKGWPQGLIKKLFYNLYESDIVFEDAYGVWREDVSDETPGKDKALFQVNEFLQWLSEAAEDDGDDDDD